ncbi:MAG: Gfo/Idh/MocA family oxidoreductase [Planctomycetaceae bacterium]|nr:Gfo/Idh/MocA family oxidoreductase [Planctomycetaceae bacterium]
MMNRRHFLQSSAAAASVLAAPALVRARNLNSKLQLVAVGCDGKGYSDVAEMASHEQARYVGFCDVDLARTEKVKKLAPEVPIFQDWRVMYAELGDKFDGVTVSTPDHMHAIITLPALQMGKHVHCQKPLTHNVTEARLVRLQTEKSGVITRMGNQIHSHSYYRTAVAGVQSGAIGKVKQVHSWVAVPGHGRSFHISRPTNPVPPPDSVNWEQWVGVAPMRPYGGPDVYHPWGWRDWQAFGNGALGYFGCHVLDPVFSALDINAGPTQFKADHIGMNDEVWPAQNTVDYIFPGTRFTLGDTFPLTWNDGGRLPSTKGSHLPPNEALPPNGSLLIGEAGSVVIPHVGEPRWYFAEGAPRPKIETLPSLNHYHGWIDGCLSGKQPTDGFDYGARLTEAVLLGNIAVRYRLQTLHWDDANLRITNLDEANQYLTRDYRSGWELPALT